MQFAIPFMHRSKRSVQEVVVSAAIASCYKRFKSADDASEVPARDHDEELIHELEDGRSNANSRQIILSQYWNAVLVTPAGAGEPSTQIKFTPRFHSLSVAHKLRLLEATQRDEVATDLLKNFQTMSGMYGHLGIKRRPENSFSYKNSLLTCRSY